jgi:UDP-N-acetylglucosamine 2-epimerase (non-hydrolysing)
MENKMDPSSVPSENTMKIAIILGTRPEIIKLSPVIRECQKQGLDFFILHTNQHYSENMDKTFFEELHLPTPKYNLGIKESLHGQMIGKMIAGIETILIEEKPDWLLVQGDTNTVLSGAIAANKLGIKVGHVEAGLRSYDRAMPEEINRILTDHISDALFCPTDAQVKILEGEGIAKDKIFLTGNTIVDAVEENRKLATNIVSSAPEKYVLLTLHRPSNVDTKDTLSGLITALENVSTRLDIPLYWPIHPRAQVKIDEFGIKVDPTKIIIVPPVGYLEMIKLESEAELILTDSGGVQEEACILHVPCVTLRDNTERPETINVGANMLYRGNDNLLSNARVMLAVNKTWENPYGDSNTSVRILKHVLE